MTAVTSDADDKTASVSPREHFQVSPAKSPFSDTPVHLFESKSSFSGGEVTQLSFRDNTFERRADSLLVHTEFLHQADGGFVVHFPAFPDACTQGASFDESIAMAKDCLSEYLKAGGTSVFPAEEFLATENDVIMAIEINMDEIRKPEAA